MRRLLTVSLVGLSVVLLAGCATGVTGSPVSVTGSTALLRGNVVSSVGGRVEFWVQYGPTPAYGSETPHDTVSTQPGAPSLVAVQAEGLALNKTYHYRLCARDAQQGSGAPGCGADRTFTTQSFDCGETVTHSVRLTADARCGLAAPALIVGAAGIDINLAGHALATGFLSGGVGPPAILNSSGFSDVTIRNGDLPGGSNAVLLQGASRNSIRDVDASAGGSAVIQIERGEANEIRHSDIDGRGSGIGAIASNGVVIADNTVRGAFGNAISVNGDLARIVRNSLPAESRLFPVASPTIDLAGSDGRIVDNRVGAGGAARGSELGIILRIGARNVIAENEVSGVPLFGGSPQAGDGIFVEIRTTETLIRDNLSQRNGGDGIEVQSASARLRGNSASLNGDFGIDAAAGVTDLGGNSASGNGNPLQCRNVFCL